MSFSDIRLRSNDILVDMINDLIIKANSSAAITDQVTDKDRISPIRLVKSKIELTDKGMFTGYSRLVTSNTSFFMPMEPDGKNVRIMTKFDCGGEKMIDYAYMDNDIRGGFQTTTPQLLKNTMDDGVTAGEVCSVLDGQQHYYKVPVNPNNSIKQMVATSQPGFTFVFRIFPLLVTNEAVSSGQKRATLLYYIENDQVDYGLRVEVGDNGVLHMYVKYLNNYYYSFTSSAQITSALPPDYDKTDFDNADYNTLLTIAQTFPIDYADLAFSFNFSTKAISIFKNGVSVPVTVGATPPSSSFPPSFADPPPPTTQPSPYIKPVVNVYNVSDASGTAVKINAKSTTPQNAPYNVPPGDPTSDPFIQTYNIAPGVPTTADPFVLLTSSGDFSKTPSSWIPLCKDATNTNNCSQAAMQITATTSSSSGDIGQILTTTGKPITQWFAVLKGTNGPVGTVYARMWDDKGNIARTYAADDAAHYDNVTVTLGVQDTTNTTIMAQGWRIGFEYTTGTTNDVISVGRLNDTDNTVCQSVVHPGASTWSTNTTYDPLMEFWTGKGDDAGNPYIELANTTGAQQGCGENFGAGCTMEFLIPTTIELTMYRTTTATAGTVMIYHRASDFSIKGTLTSFPVTSLPTAQPTLLNIVWQDTTYGQSIMAGDIISVEVTGVTAGVVRVMNNSGFTDPVNSYNGANSFLVTKAVGASTWVSNTSLDLNAIIQIGGQMFSGYIELNDTRKRTGAKVNTINSSLVNVIPTMITATFAKFNNPATGTIDCYIRNSAGAIMATMGHFPISGLFVTDLSVDFENRQNTYKLAVGDTISVEYSGGTATDYIIVKINTAQVDNEDTSLFETLSSNLNAANQIKNRDFSCIVYTGGVPDLNARPMRGFKINDNSALIGQPVTQVELNLRAVGTFQFGNPLNVKIIRGKDKQTMSVLGTKEANQLISPGFQTVEFANTTNTYALAAGDMIGVEFNYGDIQNYVLMEVSGSNVFDGANTCMFDYDTFKYTDSTANDITGQMWIGGNLVIPDPVAIPKPVPYHYYHGYVVGAGQIPDSGALVDPDMLNPSQNTYFNMIAKEFRMYSMLLTGQQLLNLYNNKFTISSLAFGHIAVQGHHIININDNI